MQIVESGRKMFGTPGKDIDATLSRSMEELRLKTASHMDAWGLGATDRWDIDLEDGVIWFTNPGLLVIAPVQVIGTYNLQDGTWLWAWDHPSVDPPLARDSGLVHAFGEHHGLSRYTTSKIRCTEDEAWEFTALACHLAGASGAYRGPSETAHVYVTFHDVTIRSSVEGPVRNSDA